MAGFCTKCGRPLPESGVCPCTMQQPQYQQQSQYQQPQYQQPQYQQQYQQPQYQQPAAPQQPSAFGLAMKNLPKLWLAYFKNPIGATRKAVEQKDFLSGIILAVITYISVFFATLVYVLRIGVHFPVGAWLVGSLMMPAFAFGFTLLGFFLLCKVGKVQANFKGILAATGLSTIFPAGLVLVSILFLLVWPGFLSLFSVLCFSVWAIMAVATVCQVFGAKLNLVSILILVGFFAVSYFFVDLFRDWIVSGCYYVGLDDIFRSFLP